MKGGYKKWLLILFIPLVLFFKIQPYPDYKYVATAGDFFPVINPENTYNSNSFAFRSNINNGYADNTANLFSHYSPYLTYELLLSKIGISQLIRTYLFLILLSFLGCLCMYLYLSSKGSFKNISKFRLFLLSIIYGFSPYFINYYLPGHFLFLLLPAVFPIVQLLFEKIIISSKKEIWLSLKYSSVLSFIFLLLCTTFANLGVLAIFISLMVGQLILFLLIRQINIRQFAITFSLFLLSLFIANIWWLAPYLVTMGNVSAMTVESRQTIGNSIGVATANSNILNSISGFPEGINSGGLFQLLQITLLSVLTLSLLVILINKKKINIGLLLIILVTLFFIKGPNFPFDNLFNYLYEKIVYLQVLRRPASKLYWIFIFFVISLIYSAIAKIPQKMKGWAILVNIVLCLSSLLTVSITLDHMSLTPFNIPVSYPQVNQYLIEDNVTKILLLPDLSGSSPEYGQELNYHRGTDFIGQIFEFKKYIPNATSWSTADEETKKVNELANNIYLKKDFCKLSKGLNISHIVIRKDLKPTNYDEKLLVEASFVLSNSKSISQIKEFGNSFKIFKLENKCQSDLISTDEEAEIKFEKINPTKYKVNLSTKTNKVTIIYREKYNRSWVLHNNSLKNFLSQIIPTTKNDETLFVHSQILDYANGWTIDLTNYCSLQKNKCSKKGDIITADFYIEYWPQKMFYLGRILSVISFIFCFGYLIHCVYTKNNLNRKQ